MRRLLAFVAVLLCESSCGHASPSRTSAPGPGRTYVLQLAQHVPPGTELLRCTYVTLGDASVFLGGLSHTFSVGNHHVTVYTTDVDAAAAPAGTFDCGDEAELHATGAIFDVTEPTGDDTLPPGVGLPIAQGATLLVQVHYLDAGAGPLDVATTLSFALRDAGEVASSAGVLLVQDPYVHVPAGAQVARAAVRATLQRPIHVIGAVADEHARGIDLSAYVEQVDGGLGPTPFYESESWAHPPELPTPVDVDASVRFVCVYANGGGSQEYFAGPSLDSQERCGLSLLYYPALTAADVRLDGFGAGSATCGATLACLRQCGASQAGSAVGPPSDAHADPCWQACLPLASESSSDGVVALAECAADACVGACASWSSSQCTSCLQTSCSKSFGACEAGG